MNKDQKAALKMARLRYRKLGIEIDEFEAALDAPPRPLYKGDKPLERMASDIRHSSYQIGEALEGALPAKILERAMAAAAEERTEPLVRRIPACGPRALLAAPSMEERKG